MPQAIGLRHLNIDLSEHLFEGLLDDSDGFHELFLVDAQGGSEADDVVVGGLSQQTVVTQLEADVPSGLALDGLGDDGVQQTAAAHLHDER